MLDYYGVILRNSFKKKEIEKLDYGGHFFKRLLESASWNRFERLRLGWAVILFIKIYIKSQCLTNFAEKTYMKEYLLRLDLLIKGGFPQNEKKFLHRSEDCGTL